MFHYKKKKSMLRSVSSENKKIITKIRDALKHTVGSIPSYHHKRKGFHTCLTSPLLLRPAHQIPWLPIKWQHHQSTAHLDQRLLVLPTHALVAWHLLVHLIFLLVFLHLTRHYRRCPDRRKVVGRPGVRAVQARRRRILRETQAGSSVVRAVLATNQHRNSAVLNTAALSRT